jgi:hypothetical protein
MITNEEIFALQSEYQKAAYAEIGKATHVECLVRRLECAQHSLEEVKHEVELLKHSLKVAIQSELK